MGSALTGKMRGLLLSRIRPFMIVIGAIAGLLVIGSIVIDEGEIVELRTVDPAGRDHVTEVWIVDLPEGSYLRSGSRETSWLERIRSRPEIVLTREEQEVAYRAIPRGDETTRRQVNDAMRAKYGFADQIWERLGDHAAAVPIRLEPSGAVSPRVAH